MKKFFIKSILFILPFVLYSVTVVIVDPYDYFGITEFATRQQKKPIAYRLNYALWKNIEFRKSPKQNLLLGDSRMNRIDPHNVSAETGEHYYNFSYGGGTIDESIATFWEAAKLIELKKVYFGINFDNFSSNNTRNRVPGALATIENPLLYITNRDVLKSTLLIMKSKFTKSSIDIEKPPMSEAEFWNYQLDVIARRYYLNYRYPQNIYHKLKHVAAYCHMKQIDLFFVVLPTHVSQQEKVNFYKLEDSQRRFKDALSVLGVVYDFDYPSILTKNRGNFTDPYHINKSLNYLIIKDIWGDNKLKYAKIISKNIE